MTHQYGSVLAQIGFDKWGQVPGYREMEEYFCPRCGKQAGSAFTSGMPTVDVREPKETT